MTDRRSVARWRWVSVLLLAVAACADDGETVYVVGDSTMAQIESVTGSGATKSGCGFTSDADCLIPLDDEVPDDIDVIVASVSTWDRFAGVEEVAAGYRDYHATLSASAPVVWIELPPVFNTPPSHPSFEEAENLNASVTAALGCELAPWSLRAAISTDGVHYAESGLALVADRFAALTPEDAC